MNLNAAVDDSVRRLDSDWLEESLARDPYWPKFDSPWWHMVLLWELGLADRIPARAVHGMTQALDSFFLHDFPFDWDALPADIDPSTRVMCHCGLGTMYRLLTDCGVDVDGALPWARGWFVRYQLPDGGLNCDETAYLKENPHSSPTSTVPPLEAMLLAAPRHKPLSEEEERFLDRGAEYLLARQLHRSLSKGGEMMNELWLTPAFPRFYKYDVLRGLEFVTAWAERRGRPLPPLDEVREALRHEGVRDFTATYKTRQFVDGELQNGHPASSFPLLEAARLRAPAIVAERRARVT